MKYSELYDRFDSLIDDCEKLALTYTAQTLRALRDNLPDDKEE
jgi:hypothetical protein